MLNSIDLAGVRVKIERAKKHIADLRAAWDPIGYADTNSSPYRTYTDIDPKTREQIVRMAILDPLDPNLGAIAGDAVHNLRSALDLLMWQLVIAGGGTPNDETMFPIGRSKKNFETALAGRIQGASANVRVLMESLKPYKGGNDALWRIHRIDIVDKHHVLIPTGIAIEAVMVPDNVPFDGARRRMIPNLISDPIFPLEDGAEILRLPPSSTDPEVNVHAEAICEVAFSEPEVVIGKAMIPTLTQLANYVEGVVHAFSILP